MFLFMTVIWWGFRSVAATLRIRQPSGRMNEFVIWSLGASLFAHAVTCIAVAYFDQSVLFLYVNLAAIGSLWAAAAGDTALEAAGLPWRDGAGAVNANPAIALQISRQPFQSATKMLN